MRDSLSVNHLVIISYWYISGAVYPKNSIMFFLGGGHIMINCIYWNISAQKLQIRYHDIFDHIPWYDDKWRRWQPVLLRFTYCLHFTVFALFLFLITIYNCSNTSVILSTADISTAKIDLFTARTTWGDLGFYHFIIFFFPFWSNIFNLLLMCMLALWIGSAAFNGTAC